MADFVKHNSSTYPYALTAEARGLEALADALQQAGVSGLRVPVVKSVTEREMVMPRISAGPASEAAMAMLGDGLARLHGLRQPHYGFDSNNMIGLSPQSNRLTDNWGEFFLHDRLGVQVGMIRSRVLRQEFQASLENKSTVLEQFLNEHCEHPSLLHGDLWSGNVLFDNSGPWLIDPAVYWGDREADIAMTELFGGFSGAFYQAYDRVCPRTRAYGDKKAIYNLYHTLNHYNLFGSAYLDACRRNMAVIERL